MAAPRWILVAFAGAVYAWAGDRAITLDAGPGADPGSLHVDGTVVRWMRDGVPCSGDLAA